MKYKPGDKVRIKSLDWYNANKDEDGDVPLIQMCDSKYTFIADMSCFCGKIVTINNVCRGSYDIKEDDCCFYWTDEMIEGLADETVVPQEKMVSLETVCKWIEDNIFDFPWYDSEGEFSSKDVADALRKYLED